MSRYSRVRDEFLAADGHALEVYATSDPYNHPALCGEYHPWQTLKPRMGEVQCGACREQLRRLGLL